MSLEAGKLRSRVDIQQRVETQDPVTGAMVLTWEDEWTGIPAAIDDLSQRDMIAAQAMQSTVSSRITLRYFAGLTSQHRIIDHDGIIYTIEGPPIRDKDTRREFMTLSVSVGPSDGE